MRAILALCALAACADPPVDLGFDGNFVVGDARDRDDAISDLGDTLSAEAGLDVDAESSDAAPLDGADADSSDRDGGIEACEATATETLSVLAAIASAPRLDGLVVDVVGTATISSRATCVPSATPCKDVCVAPLELSPLLPLESSACFAEIACEGSACGAVCRPLVGIELRFRGTLRARTGTPSAALELLGVLLL
ncbi:MAG: hypothetical protein HYV07_10795 [Deltaproteobacteria bacterium]|nr:hypothetical protein [Deltaproteobacteria bacterium]